MGSKPTFKSAHCVHRTVPPIPCHASVVPNAELMVWLHPQQGAETLSGETWGWGSTVFFRFNPFFLIDYCSHL